MLNLNQIIHTIQKSYLKPLLSEEFLVPFFIFSPVVIVILVFTRAIYLNIIYPFRQKTKRFNQYGYILNSNEEFEHRAVVEKLIKRKLQRGEEVHHINGVKWDNRKSNLALMTREDHVRWHKRLEWMWEQKMSPSIRWQRNKLRTEFGATLF